MESASGESRKGHRNSLSPGSADDASPVEAERRPPDSMPCSATYAGPTHELAANRAVPADERSGAARVVAGNAGDHKPIFALLRAAVQTPSYEDFLTWLDEPTYEPTDRLLVKTGGQIVAHLHLFDRLAWFGGVRLPIGGVQDLATFPEYRGAGYEQVLLAGAERALRDRQAIVVFARTDRPEVFRAAGWFEARSQRCTQANVNDILALIASPNLPWGRRGKSLSTRFWRHVELDALQSICRSGIHGAWGALDRPEPYWRWLVNRKAHDELLVVVHGEDKWAELDAPAHIVGYAVMQGSRVVELFMLPGYAKAAPRLLARACQDAIEQGHRELALDLPVDHPLHQLMLAAGGNWTSGGRNGNSLMLKLLAPGRWIECMYPVLLARAKDAGLSRPLQLTFDTGRCAYRLELTRRSGHLIHGDRANCDVACAPETFAALVVGNLDVAASRSAGLLEIPDEAVAARLAALFPAVPFWQSQFDTLRF